MTTRTTRPLRLPTPPPRPARAPFPLVASAAPIAAAVVLWAITGAPSMLMFAAIGPLVAVGGLIDGARTRSRTRRTARKEHRRAVLLVREGVEAAHAEERATAWLEHPSALDRFLGGPDDPRRWGGDGPIEVTAGTGTTRSAVAVLDDRPGGPGRPAWDSDRDADLRLPETIDDMPVVVAVAGGIGVVGPDSLVRTVLRGLLLQLCDQLPPHRLGLLALPEAHWRWAEALPHATEELGGRASLIVVHRLVDDRGAGRDAALPDDRSGLLVLAGAPAVRALPPGCATIIVVRSAIDAEIVRSPSPSVGGFVPELVGEEQAVAHARLLAAGRSRPPRIPGHVRFGELDHTLTGVLGCAVGVGSRGAVVVDLVVDGPHAVVGGTTGSGKSELLVTWIASMAAHASPADFTFLLVDFKGGATGTALSGLPHCLGVVTDLDGPLSDRVLRGLDAEIRRRERVIMSAGARAIDDLPAGVLPRLVIVVDEFAALLASAPDLHVLFADIAARGRSLGLHLILCTQRPAGVVRESLLANCGLRIALRVNDASDSQAIVGVPDAAGIPPGAVGRCLIGRGRQVLECQVAETDAEAVRRIAVAAPPAARPPTRPWIEPLPSTLSADDPIVRAVVDAEPEHGAGGGALLGVCDEPGRQRRVAARWRTGERGMIVHGGPRSGRTSSLFRLASELPGARYVPADVEGTWDALEWAESAAGGAVLLDDWDAVAGLWTEDHRHAAIERLSRILHSARCRVAVAARRPAALGSALGLFESRLVLRLDDRADHLAAGVVPALWDDSAPPGRGVWGGLAVQVIADGRGPTGSAPPELPSPAATATGALVVVSARPRSAADALRVALPGRDVVELVPGGRPPLDIGGRSAPVLVGDPEGWLATGGAFAALRAGTTVAFDSCSLNEFRMLARTREIPPAIRPGSSRIWVLAPDGAVTRGRLVP